MTQYINMDSFGSNCPENWEEIADYLNDKISDALEDLGDDAYCPGYCDNGLSADGNEVLSSVWEAYCNGEYPDCPEAEYSEPMTYGDYMLDHPEENLYWCRPYFSADGRYAIAVNEGEIIEAVTPDGHMPEGHVSPLTKDEIHTLAQAVNPDYSMCRGYTDEELIYQVMREGACADCPFFHQCDAMQQEME